MPELSPIEFSMSWHSDGDSIVFDGCRMVTPSDQRGDEETDPGSWPVAAPSLPVSVTDSTDRDLEQVIDQVFIDGHTRNLTSTERAEYWQEMARRSAHHNYGPRWRWLSSEGRSWGRTAAMAEELRRYPNAMVIGNQQLREIREENRSNLLEDIAVWIDRCRNGTDSYYDEPTRAQATSVDSFSQTFDLERTDICWKKVTGIECGEPSDPQSDNGLCSMHLEEVRSKVKMK